MRVTGIDHVDVRVRSLAQVEAFYDAVLPELGLTDKREAHVGSDGEWCGVDDAHPRNAMEYHTPREPGVLGWFVGFIEDGNASSATRVAFGLDSEAELAGVEPLVRNAGGRVVEWSSDAGYPALFFEDPIGTRLEVCARRR
jgi:catechol 2,3-dioxygenase-like lactoylglutathione lyase family enzyme